MILIERKPDDINFDKISVGAKPFAYAQTMKEVKEVMKNKGLKHHQEKGMYNSYFYGDGYLYFYDAEINTLDKVEW